MCLVTAAVFLLGPQNLHRKRALGNGPYGAVHASYTPDGESLVAGFQVQSDPDMQGGV